MSKLFFDFIVSDSQPWFRHNDQSGYCLGALNL